MITAIPSTIAFHHIMILNFITDILQYVSEFELQYRVAIVQWMWMEHRQNVHPFSDMRFSIFMEAGLYYNDPWDPVIRTVLLFCLWDLW